MSKQMTNFTKNLESMTIIYDEDGYRVMIEHYGV
nr:hypothetical protein ELOWGMBK_ELOWGMBK_CDS_0034 [Herelleviridae sp.]